MTVAEDLASVLENTFEEIEKKLSVKATPGVERTPAFKTAIDELKKAEKEFTDAMKACKKGKIDTSKYKSVSKELNDRAAKINQLANDSANAAGIKTQTDAVADILKKYKTMMCAYQKADKELEYLGSITVALDDPWVMGPIDPYPDYRTQFPLNLGYDFRDNWYFDPHINSLENFAVQQAIADGYPSPYNMYPYGVGDNAGILFAGDNYDTAYWMSYSG